MTSTATTTPQQTRDQAVAAYKAEYALFEAAKGKGNKKAALSHGGRLATISMRIREAELDMALAGVKFTTWAKPVVSKTRLTPLSQTEIEANLANIVKVYRNKSMPESVRHTADTRISALLRAAEKRGYSVKDPRKS